MKIAIVSGNDEGPTKLNAFDNALAQANIGDVNLIKVSSMLGANTEIVDLPPLKTGSMINCVLSETTSDKKGDKLISTLAIAIGKNLGCVAENSAINQNEETLINETKFMVEYMMKKRKEPIEKLIIKKSTHVVEKTGSAIAALIYLKDD